MVTANTNAPALPIQIEILFASFLNITWHFAQLYRVNYWQKLYEVVGYKMRVHRFET